MIYVVCFIIADIGLQLLLIAGISKRGVCMFILVDNLPYIGLFFVATGVIFICIGIFGLAHVRSKAEAQQEIRETIGANLQYSPNFNSILNNTGSAMQNNKPQHQPHEDYQQKNNNCQLQQALYSCHFF